MTGTGSRKPWPASKSGMRFVRAAVLATVIAVGPAGAGKVKVAQDINWPVSIVAQSRTMSCWAAATAMLMSWKQHVAVSEEQAARAAGNNYLIAFQQNQGVTGAEIADLAKLLGLVAEPPSSLTAAGYRALLARGPLWVGTAIFSPTAVYRHVRIVAGLREPIGAQDPILDIIDPDGGRRYGETVSQFAREMEEIARQDLGANRELRPQIIHYR